MSRKMSFFEFWRSMKEKGALLERANQLRLLPSQLKQLHGDGVRAVLQNTRMASLLPPVGTEVFRRFTPASLGEIQQRHEAEEREHENRMKNKEVEKHQPKPASVLEAGKPLPFIYGVPPPELHNTPLEELDAYYQSQKTFVVLGKGNIIHRFNAEPACYLLSPFSPLRTVAIKILTHSLFNLLIMVTILTNCAFMTITDPPEWSRTMEYVFTAIYTFEVIIKVVSRGFCMGKFTFLRDPWNWLDVIVIITAYLTAFIHIGKCSVLSTIPRILKTIPLISGLKSTVRALVQSVKKLAGVIILIVLCLSIMAVIAMQLFMGGLKHKCVIMPTPNTTNFSDDLTPGYYDNETGSSFDYANYMNNMENYYFIPGQLDALLCGNSSHAGVCPEGFTCMKWGRNPNYGYTSYDSFGWSLLTLFRLMTRDFWENLVMLTLRAEGTFFLTFFMLVVFPATFCLFSLILAVVTMAFCDQEEASAAEAKQKEEEFSQILEALKRREEEEGGEKQDSEKKSHGEESGGQRSCPPFCSIIADLLLKWNCCSCWRWLKQRLYTFITNPFFDLGIVICLIVNIVFMAMEHYPMSQEFEQHMSTAYLVFTAIFTAEMVIKIVAMDPYNYFQVSWNIFDSIIVAVSLLELSLVDVSGLSLVRSFLLMRVFRLARWWPSFHMLLKIIWTSLRTLTNATLLLLIMVFLFSVVGMQLFEKDYKDQVCRIASDCELPRWHMNDFFHACSLITRMLCGQWVETLWDCMEVAGQPICLIFFIMALLILDLLILNLFLTLLLSSVISNSLVAGEETRKNNTHVAMSRICEHIRTFLGKKNHVHTVDEESLALNVTSQHRNTESTMVPIATPEIDLKMFENEEEEEKKCDDVQKHPEVQQVEEDKDHKGDTPEDCCNDQCHHCCPFLDIDTSQGGGRVWSNFRKACLLIVKHKCFDIFIIFIILLSTVALMFEDIHLQNRPVLKRVVETVDQVCTYLFLLEMLLKWIAFGLKKYFTNAWCWLDFLVLDVFVVSLMADKLGISELGAIQFLRTLRALGPLRALSRFRGVRLVVQVLVQTISPICDALLVSLVVWLIFSILGVNLYAGKFNYCFNETSEELFLDEDVNNKSDCFFLIMENYSEVRWKDLKFNFDSVPNGYHSLLHVAAAGDWLDMLYAAVDSTQVESQPSYENNIYMYLFFIFFIIAVFYTLSFFIRVIINHLQKDKIGKHIFMTKQQQEYSKAMKKWFSKNRQAAPRPQNQCQARLFDLVTDPYFEVFMLVVIFVYLVTLIVETDDQSTEKEVILYWMHFIFIIIFLIEFIVKIIALRRFYFTNSLNVLEFIILLLMIIGMFLSDLMEKYFVSPAFFPLFRLAPLLRVFHLCHCARTIRKLLLAFVMSLPALFNIGLLLFLIMVTFSIFGMFNFGYLKKETMIDDLYNFETFWSSLMCMFMVTTSTSWGGFLWPMLNTPPDCNPYEENPGMMVTGNCGSPIVGIIFFTTYIVLYFLLLAHLYIVVVLEIFSSEDIEALCDDDLQRFYKTWRKFDADASQFIPYSKLSDFCAALQDPLRIPKPNTIKLIHMDLPLFTGDKIHCLDVFHKLAAQVVEDSKELDSLKARMGKKFMVNSSKVSYEPISSTLRRKQEEVAATVIQRAYKKGLLKPAEETAVESVDGGVSGVPGSAHPGDALE